MSPEPDRSRRTRPRAGQRAARRRRRARLFPALILVVILGLVFVLRSGGGPSRLGETTGTQGSRANVPLHRRLAIVARPAPHSLPSALSGEAVVAQPGGVLVIGGLDSSDVSTSAVLELSSSTGRVASVGSLSKPRHDTAAALLGERVVVFAGGSVSELDSVEAIHREATGSVLGHLPSTRSDLSALTVAKDAYLLGGYDGRAPTGVVLKTADGRRFSAVATLPVAFRYAAVAAVGTTIYAFGGELGNGLDSDAIQELDTRTGRARLIGHLPRPLSHASAVVLGRQVYILGGRTGGLPTDRILSFDPATAAVTAAGRLPAPVTNAGAAAAKGIGYLVGGLAADGSSLSSVVEVRLVARGS